MSGVHAVVSAEPRRLRRRCGKPLTIASGGRVDARESGSVPPPRRAASHSLACVAVYRSTLAVDAPAERVWEVLTDFDRWAEWNPSVPSIEGEPRVGSTLTLTLAMPGRPSAKVKARLTEVVPPRRLVWDGKVGAEWLFAGHREFLIESQPDGTARFTHVEDVSGMLFPLFRAFMGGAIRRHHEGLNEAVKERAEARR